MNISQKEANNASTFAKEGNQYFKLEIRPEKESKLLTDCTIYRQLSPYQHAYYFRITKQEYKEGRQLQRETLHKSTLDKVYGNTNTTYCDILSEDYLEEQQLLREQEEERAIKLKEINKELEKEIDIDLYNKDQLMESILEDM